MCGCQAFPMIRSGFKQLPLFVAVQENKDTLKGGLDAMDHTMPFFSPAATSTVGRPGKVPPPVPPKMNSSFDDSFSKTDVVSTPQGSPLTFVCVANYCCIQCKRRCFFCVVCAAEVWKLTTGEAVPLLTKKEKVLSWCTKFMQGWKMTGANRCPEQVIVLQCPRLHHSRVQKEALAAHPPEPVRSILKEKDATVFASWSTESACKNRQCDNTSVRIIFGEHPMSRIVFPWQKPISVGCWYTELVMVRSIVLVFRETCVCAWHQKHFEEKGEFMLLLFLPSFVCFGALKLFIDMNIPCPKASDMITLFFWSAYLLHKPMPCVQMYSLCHLGFEKAFPWLWTSEQKQLCEETMLGDCISQDALLHPVFSVAFWTEQIIKIWKLL